VTHFELPGPGRPTDRRRNLVRLRDQGVKWVVVSGAVTDRVLAARERYPLEAHFYEQLRSDGAPAYSISPGGPGLAGPWVRVYRLG
jgi:hypothetical protein